MRQRVFEQQENVKAALTRAKENSESQFRELFTSTAVGMAISDLSGNLIETNRALSEILGYGTKGVSAASVYDLFHPDDVSHLRQRYEGLLTSDSPRFREQRRLVTKDGDDAWAFLAVSIFRYDDGTPRYHVTMIEDITDQHLLEDRLSFQVLHDALTGLPNRQHFVTRLEAALARLRPSDTITLYHLDLDNFTVINDGLGRATGDEVLEIVSRRLQDVVADEKAIVARLGGDEFAILVEGAGSGAEVSELAGRINDELAEPVYLNDHGVAASASIAVVQRQVGQTHPADLLGDAERTLRRVKAKGGRQWGLSDATLDERDHSKSVLAATLPGAWESGQIVLEYQPQYSLADRELVAVQALLRWDHPEFGMLDHEQCVEVIQETGLLLTIGRWMLGRATEQAVAWEREFGAGAPALAVDLSAYHAGDPDLVAGIRRIIDEIGLPARRMRLGMPVSALCMVDGEAEDNLDTLIDLGVVAVLYGFGTTRGDLACLEDLPVHAVSVPCLVTDRVARPETGKSVFAQSMHDLLPLVRETGVSILVQGIKTEDQADWWVSAGADLGQGPLFGEAMDAEAIEALFPVG